MKKYFLILAVLTGFGISSFGQTIIVQKNSGSNSQTQDKDNCGYRINGICTSEDIGGVQVATGSDDGHPTGSREYHFVFENYNNFTVSVIYEVEVGDGKSTGTIVLRANEKKETQDYYMNTMSFKLIVRKLNNNLTLSIAEVWVATNLCFCI